MASASANSLSKLATTLNQVLPCDCRGRPTHYSPSLTTSFPSKNLKTSWREEHNKIFLHPWSFRLKEPKHRSFSTISLSLPTAKPERVSSSEKVPRWSSKAIKSFAMAELEARKLKYPTTGTEALVMGILIEGTNAASKFLRAHAITLLKVRDEIVKLLGKADMYYFSPEHPPLTEEAQRALDFSVDQKLKSGDNGEITTIHLLLGVWSQTESPGHKILSMLGFNDEKAKELDSLISEPGFVEN